MKIKNIILLSGISGAGKSSVSNMLEDLGYYCIDQYPVDLVEDLIALLKSSDDIRYSKLVLTTTLQDFNKFYIKLKNDISCVSVILLDASKDVLINRYRFTRRVHPFLLSNKADGLEMAISLEKEMLEKVYNDSFTIIDTSQMSNRDLRIKLESFIHNEGKLFSVSFESFGFKYGQAKNGDLVFDVRFLENPYYIEKLKNLTGLDNEVYEYVLSFEETKNYLQKLQEFLEYNFKMYQKEGKRHFTVAIGCTGGKHRSVSVARFLYGYYKEKFQCYISHRDIEK